MLPLPPVTTSPLSTFVRRIDGYTLWAFNTQRPLRPERPSER